jgi:hypothetical protein
MRTKLVGAGLILVVLAGVVAFAVLRDTTATDASSSTEAAEDQKAAPEPAPSPATAEEARLLLEINQVIAEVTKEAIERPKDQRMTKEEINALITSRIEELKARQQ